jgi:hypothetical protein
LATLLSGVNAVLKRIGVIKGNSGELASLTDEQRQVVIDLTIQAWNEILIDVFDSSEIAVPNEVSSNTITLATGDRDYALQTNVVQLRWPFKNLTTGHEIHEYPGGWEQLISDQTIPGNYTGQASYAVIDPSDGELYLDMIPTANENGDVYTYYYDKSLLMSAAADVFPFSDTVYTSLIPAVAELVKRDREKSFDKDIYKRRVALAVGQMTKQQLRSSWAPVRNSSVNSSDPLEA